MTEQQLALHCAYWAEEVHLGSPALGRLESICRAHGWDYAATVEALAQ